MTGSSSDQKGDPLAAARAAKALKAEQTTIRMQKARAALKIKRLGTAAHDVSKEPTVDSPVKSNSFAPNFSPAKLRGDLPEGTSHQSYGRGASESASITSSNSRGSTPEASKNLADLYENWEHERQPDADVLAAHMGTSQTNEQGGAFERQRSETPSVLSSVGNRPDQLASKEPTPDQSPSRSLSRHSSREMSVDENADHAAKLDEFYANWEHDRQPDYSDLPGYMDSDHDLSPALSETELRSGSGTGPASPSALAPKAKRERPPEHSQEEPTMKKARLDERDDRSRSPLGRA